MACMPSQICVHVIHFNNCDKHMLLMRSVENRAVADLKPVNESFEIERMDSLESRGPSHSRDMPPGREQHLIECGNPG